MRIKWECEEFDDSVIYLTVRDLSNESGRSKDIIKYDIRKGFLPACKQKIHLHGDKRTCVYLIHPEDAKKYTQETKNGRERVLKPYRYNGKNSSGEQCINVDKGRYRVTVQRNKKKYRKSFGSLSEAVIYRDELKASLDGGVIRRGSRK